MTADMTCSINCGDRETAATLASASPTTSSPPDDVLFFLSEGTELTKKRSMHLSVVNNTRVLVEDLATLNIGSQTVMHARLCKAHAQRKNSVSTDKS